MDVSSLSIDEFLQQLGSSDPTPGGGSLAALSGAMAAAMLAMVCNLTIGRPRYADVESEVQEILRDALSHQHRLVALTNADMEVYEGVRDAYRLSRETEADKSHRALAIEHSMHGATEVPVQTAEASRDLVDLALRAGKITSVNALGDVAVAVHLAAAAARGGAEQARLNLATVTDTGFASGIVARLAKVGLGMDEVIAETLDAVRDRAGA